VRLTIRGNIARWTGHAANATAARDQFAEFLPPLRTGPGPEPPDTLTNRARWTG
jgi:hypothetical protein